MATLKILPKLIIFKALGGYTAKEKGKPVENETENVLKELAKYLKRTQQIIDVNYKGEIEFFPRKKC